MKISLIGAGGFAREVKAQILDTYPDFQIDFFVSDDKANGKFKSIKNINFNSDKILIAIGDPSTRKKVFSELPLDVKYFTFIHKSVKNFDAENKIGDGTIICADCILTNNIVIGKHVHLNLKTTIGHDTSIGNFVTTAPAVNISGNCTIHDGVYIGTNTAIKEKIEISNDIIFGLNSGIVKNITDIGVYGGCPARKIK